MEEIGAIFLIWLTHAGFAGVLSAPVVLLGRRRVHWRAWESLVLVLPFTIWSVLMFSELATGKKSLANLGEPFYFAAAIPVAALIRVALGSRVSERVCAGSLIAAVCFVAVGVFFFVPPLPE